MRRIIRERKGVKMVKKKEPKYKYVSKTICEKCNIEAEYERPCVECGNMVFKRILVLREVE